MMMSRITKLLESELHFCTDTTDRSRELGQVVNNKVITLQRFGNTIKMNARRITHAIASRLKVASSSNVSLGSLRISTRPLSTDVADDENYGLHELREYTLHTDQLPKYLELTGSSAFDARTNASPLLGFFVLEMGGQLNKVVHLWEYENLDHRTEVRKELSTNQGFLDYFAAIRPMLASQSSVLLRPHLWDPDCVNGDSGLFMLSRRSLVVEEENFEEDDEGEESEDEEQVQTIGHWEEILGDRGTEWALERSTCYQSLLDNADDTERDLGWNVRIMAPTPFSPLK